MTGPPAHALVLGGMVELSGERIYLALSGLETITQGQIDVSVGAITFRLVNSDDRLHTGHADFNTNMEEFGSRRSSSRCLDNNAGVRKTIEM